MTNIRIIDHPLVKHKISLLCDKETSTKDFRSIVKELSMLLTYELTRDLTYKQVQVETPLGMTTATVVKTGNLAIVPILRGGLAMVDGLLTLLPSSKVGHIGMFKDKQSGEIVTYYCKFPQGIASMQVLLCEPMLASGRTAVEAIRHVKEAGCTNIKFVTLLASPQSLSLIVKEYPDVEIVCAGVALGLDENGYIVPGFGDAGDRTFGTK